MKRQIISQLQKFGLKLSQALRLVDIPEVRCKDGYRVRILNFIDDASRYFLGYLAQRSILGRDAARFLDELCRRYGPPKELRRDDGPEFRSRAFQEVLGRWRIKEVVIPPGSLYYNGQIESLHSTKEKELFRREIFRDIHELREKLVLWREYYNLRRPHLALEYQTPWEV